MKTCVYCGKSFPFQRSSAMYCSDSCKTMAYRQRRRELLAYVDSRLQQIAEKRKREVELVMECQLQNDFKANENKKTGQIEELSEDGIRRSRFSRRLKRRRARRIQSRSVQ